MCAEFIKLSIKVTMLGALEKKTKGKGREVERIRQTSLTQIGHRYGIGTHS